jgi:hypothetical protein
VVNEQLSGVQQRNLEVAWGVPVVDRVGMVRARVGRNRPPRAAPAARERACRERPAGLPIVSAH